MPRTFREHQWDIHSLSAQIYQQLESLVASSMDAGGTAGE